MLQGKTAIITGASRGLGAEIAKRFAKEGVKHLVLIAKNLEGLKLVDDEIRKFGGETTLVPFDLQNLTNIESIINSISAKFESIDIFVANAAILGNLNLLQEYDQNTWKSVFDINFHANWYLIKYLDPLLKKSTAGKAIFVTSEIVDVPQLYPSWGAYAASKSALETMVKIYATETKHTKLCINIVHPANPINSGIYTTAFPTQSKLQLISPDKLTDKFVELSLDTCDVTGEVYKLSITDQ